MSSQVKRSSLADPIPGDPETVPGAYGSMVLPSYALGRAGLGIFMRKGQHKVTGAGSQSTWPPPVLVRVLLGVAGQLVCP